MKTRKTYERPSMRVVEFKRRPALLAGSNGDAGLQDYNWNNVDPE